MDGRTFTAQNEGCKLVAYLDSLGKPTLGRGRHEGISLGMTCTQEQADDWFNNEDYPAAAGQAMVDVGMTAWYRLDDIRKAALTDMAFEMGETGLSKFVKMIQAVQLADWATASAEAKASLYDQQVPDRAHKVEYMLLNGQWPEGVSNDGSSANA